MNIDHDPVYLLLGCFGLAFGLLGAALGAWFIARRTPASTSPRARIDTSYGDAEILRVVEAAVQSAMSGVEATLVHRIPEWVQQAVRVELEFQTRQQVEREEARSHEHRRWQVRHGEQRMAEIRALLQVLSAQLAHLAPDAAIEPTPLRFEDADAGVDLAALSDEEIDALSPELPLSTRPRKRILPAPKKPTLRDI